MLYAIRMIRITTTSSGDHGTTIRVEGQLAGTAVSELVTVTSRLSDGEADIALDLVGVPFADKDGEKALRSLIAQGARIEKCSGFLKHLLRSKAGAPCEGVSASEAEMLQRLRDGHEAAFEQLVQRFGGRMLSVARRLLGSEDDARDAVQEAFLAAFASIHDFNGTSMLSTWMHRIVVNAALMQLRRRRRKPEHSIDELLPRFTANGPKTPPLNPSRWNRCLSFASRDGRCSFVFQNCRIFIARFSCCAT